MRECRNCNGSGYMKCPVCGADGTMHDGTTCYYCQGKRYVECAACNGTGKIND